MSSNDVRDLPLYKIDVHYHDFGYSVLMHEPMLMEFLEMLSRKYMDASIYIERKAPDAD